MHYCLPICQFIKTKPLRFISVQSRRSVRALIIIYSNYDHWTVLCVYTEERWIVLRRNERHQRFEASYAGRRNVHDGKPEANLLQWPTS